MRLAATNTPTVNQNGLIDFTGTRQSDSSMDLNILLSPGGNAAPSSFMFMDGSTGNVGIGKATPAAKLHLRQEDAGTNNITNIFYLSRESSNTVANDFGIAMVFQAENAGGSPGSNQGAIQTKWLNATTGTAQMEFLVRDGGWNTVPEMVIDNNGNVGIGTTAPDSKLEVSGGDIRVTGGGFIDDGVGLSVPDYVFETNYPTRSISELRTFIDENKHLPGLPSMDDTEGWAALSLQAREMKILEKVEEKVLTILK